MKAFAGSNGFNVSEFNAKASVREIYDSLSDIPKQIDKITKWLHLLVERNADAILFVIYHTYYFLFTTHFPPLYFKLSNYSIATIQNLLK